MKVYHRTSAGRAILAGGFRDGEGTYMTTHVWRGVWVSDRDLADLLWKCPTLFVLEVPEELLREYEWVQEGLEYREFLVPAALLNTFGPPTLVDSTDES